MAARVGNPSDIRRAAAEIMQANPLGGICGMVCPDTLCMAACTHKKFDGAINIPLVQATLVKMTKDLEESQIFVNQNKMARKLLLLVADRLAWERQQLCRRWVTVLIFSRVQISLAGWST